MVVSKINLTRERLFLLKSYVFMCLSQLGGYFFFLQPLESRRDSDTSHSSTSCTEGNDLGALL